MESHRMCSFLLFWSRLLLLSTAFFEGHLCGQDLRSLTEKERRDHRQWCAQERCTDQRGFQKAVDNGTGVPRDKGCVGMWGGGVVER